MKKDASAGLELLEAAYAWERPDQAWLEALVDETCRFWRRSLWGFGHFYDASDPGRLRVWNVCHRGSPKAARDALEEVVAGYPPEAVAATYRATTVGTWSQNRDPISAQILSQSGATDILVLNGLDPSGKGCLVAVATAADLDPGSALLQRMAAHLSSAYRCRRRLQEKGQSPLTTAEAVLDPSGQILDAQGPAASPRGRRGIQKAFRSIQDLREKRTLDRPVDRWRPRVEGRWTLVDVYPDRGERYIVARENQTSVPSLASLTERERQVVASAAAGRTNKEIAYELGLSHSTTRVLMARACSRLGVRSRAALLELPAVKALRGEVESAET